MQLMSEDEDMTNNDFIADTCASMLPSENGIFGPSPKSLDCSVRKLLPDIVFKINGVNFPISPDEYVWEVRMPCFASKVMLCIS